MTRLTGRSSVIFVGTKDGVKSYKSYGQMPPALQENLASSFGKENTVTILIADRAGREELRRAIQSRSVAADRAPANGSTRALRQASAAATAWSGRTWLALLLPAAMAAVLWFLIGT
jgi:hypothetical protein